MLACALLVSCVCIMLLRSAPRTWPVGCFVGWIDRLGYWTNTGTLPQPVIWSCLELSFGLIGACIPSLMPLLLVVIGKRKLGSNSRPSEYNKDGLDRSKSSKFNRMIDSDEIHLDENVTQPGSDPQLSRSDQNAFDDNVRLVNNRETGVIKITNQIMQTHEPRDPSSPLQENSQVIPPSWARRSLLAPVNQSDLKVSESLNMAIPTPCSLVSRFSRPWAVNERDTVIIFLWTG